MEIVQPIRDINKIRQIESLLKSQSHRDYMLFILGINSGLRISDILQTKLQPITITNPHNPNKINTPNLCVYGFMWLNGFRQMMPPPEFTTVRLFRKVLARIATSVPFNTKAD